MTLNGVMELVSALDSLKHLKRTGWLRMGVPEPETVACHMYRMAVLAMSLEGQIAGLDVVRTVTMSLVHDLAEAIVGDITPYCSISTEEKYERENEAIHKIAAYVPVAAVGEQWVELWKEYEAQKNLSGEGCQAFGQV
ncbi:hypothetical protein KIN20_016781 [Parelaphostrongylus tenuis]|uniref:HD domain-containing protein n=1 Tax=Parelaphostrongylus tenuis TaxID=148309 RepID=A0AAD5MGZ0_PARTN|nr:hypothetical protein KIN20_016781 [Parelaphostrongylus tenuis]